MLQVQLDHGRCELPPFQLGREAMTCSLVVELEGHGSVSTNLKVKLKMGDAVAVQPHEEAIQCKLGQEVALPITVRLFLRTCLWVPAAVLKIQFGSGQQHASAKGMNSQLLEVRRHMLCTNWLLSSLQLAGMDMTPKACVQDGKCVCNNGCAAFGHCPVACVSVACYCTC